MGQSLWVRTVSVWSTVLAVAVGLTSCSSTPQTEGQPSTNSGKLKVVASYSVLCDMLERIAQSNIDLKCLIKYNQDPHTYEGTPSDRQAIEQADLVFYAGLNFEPSIIRMVEATNTPAPKVPLHEQAVENIINVEEAGGTTKPDPHIWHDVKNGIRMVQLIETNLIKIDPQHAATYTSNAKNLTGELNQLNGWIGKQIATIPPNQRRIVTNHDAMSYYARAYGLTVVGTLLGITTEEEPTAARVRALADTIRAAQVPTLFAELTSNAKVLQTVANEAGVKISEQVLIADGVGARGTPAGSYQGMLEYNTCAIVAGLGGQCTPFAVQK